MSIIYRAVEAVTGAVIADLPNFKVDALRFTLGRPETMTGTMPIHPADPKAPENWIAASEPWCVAILPIESTTNTVVGSGMYINGRVRTQGDVASVPLVSGEGYLDRRLTGAYAPTATDQNTIATQLVSQFAVTASAAGLNGWPATTNVVGAAGTARDRTYGVADRKTVLANLTELMGVQGGPEFMVTWQHLTGPERWLPVFNVGSMIGTSPSAGLAPAVTFDLPGVVTDFAYVEDWSTGKGANSVTAYGLTDATTGIAPQQTSIYTANARQLEIDYTWNPSSSITSAADLLSHAMSQLSIMQQGTRSLALTIKGTVFPQFGVDWNLGDVVGYQIGGLNAAGKDTVPSLPGGISGNSRVIGVVMIPDVPTPTTTPILGGL